MTAYESMCLRKQLNELKEKRNEHLKKADNLGTDEREIREFWHKDSLLMVKITNLKAILKPKSYYKQ